MAIIVFLWDKFFIVISFSRNRKFEMFGGVANWPSAAFSREMSNEEWKLFLRVTESQMIAMDIKKPSRKLAYLTSCGGAPLAKLMDTLNSAEQLEDTYRNVINRLNAFFAKATNVVQARYEFGRIRQNEGERVRYFEARIREAATKCQFENVEERVKEQLIQGTNDKKVKGLALTNQNCTINDIIDQSLATELMQEVKENDRKGECSLVGRVSENRSRNIDRMYGFKRSLGQLEPKERKFENEKRRKLSCYNCGDPGHLLRNCTKPTICHNCGTKGHIQRNCNKKRVFGRNQIVRQISENQVMKSEHLDTDVVLFIDSTEEIRVVVGGVPINMIIDSGCNSNVIGKKTWEYLRANGCQGQRCSYGC